MNAELARQLSVVRAARARIHSGAVPDPGIDLRGARSRAAERPAPGTSITGQHAAHVRAWQRVLRARSPTGPRPEDVLAAVSDAWRVPVGVLMTASQIARHVEARSAAMYLSRTLAPWRSGVDVARRLGGRDHATVIRACRRTALRLERDDADLEGKIAEVRRLLGLP